MAFNRQVADDYVRKAKIYYKQLQKFKSRLEREENILIKLVLPFLRSLGWDPESRDCAFEYCIWKSGIKRRLADIALFRGKERKPRVLIEVKDTDFSKHCIEDQVPEYLRKSKVKFLILFNGERFMVFHYSRKKHLVDLKKNDFVRGRRLLRCFSKKNIGKLSLDRFLYVKREIGFENDQF